ncbi:MAG TPA: hypothetical protein DCR35_12875 [Runella sp.]|nr:hypothetical protein [Runella sp.]HAO50109.1 hypothetical protein [Runella sp.]
MNEPKALSQLFSFILLGVFATVSGIFLVVIAIFLNLSKAPISPQSTLYCGTLTYDSSWAVSNLDSTEVKGFYLFEQHCKNCHSYKDEILVGPGLKGVQERRNTKWIIEWVKNPKVILTKGDLYAVKRYEQYNRAEMPSFEHLSQTDILAILAFVEAANN